MYLSSELKNLRVSRDWVGDRWVDIEPNPNILCIISSTSVDTKLSTSSAASKEAKSDNSPTSVDKLPITNKLSAVEEEEMHVDLEGMTLTNVPLKDECIDAEQHRMFDDEEEREYSRNVELEQENTGSDLGRANEDEDGSVKVNSIIDDINGENNLVECEIAEMKCEAEAEEMLTDC